MQLLGASTSPSAPYVDERLVEPETRQEMVRGRRVIAAPANPAHADVHSDLNNIIHNHVAPGYTVSVHLLTRAGPQSDFATDAEVIQEKVVRGIATRSKKLLDDIGILVDADKANEAYAQSIGKVSSALTEQDRNKAYKAEVLRQMAVLTEKVAIETNGAAAAYQRAAVARRNFYAELAANPGKEIEIPVVDPDSDGRRAEARRKRRRYLETWEANGSLTDKAEIEELRQLRETESKGWEKIAHAMENRTEVADRFIAKAWPASTSTGPRSMSCTSPSGS